MYPSTRALAALVLAAGLVLATAASAFAAPSAWSRVDVTVHAEQSDATMMVSGRLPDDAKLPADVELAVPAGAELLWAGEILGGEASQDPSVTYSMTSREGQDVYRFRLTKARTGQLEVAAPDVVSFDGTAYRVKLDWTPTQDVAEAQLSVRVPNAANVTSATPGAALVPVGQTAYGYYSKTFTGAKAGKRLDLSFVYTGPAVAAVGTPPAGGSDALPFVLVVAFAGLVLLVIFVSRRSRARRAAEAPAQSARHDDRATPSARDEDDAPAAEVVERTGTSARAKALLVVAGFAIIVAVVATITTNASSKWENGTLTRSFAAADACTTAEFPLTVTGDLERDGGKLLDSLQTLTGIKAGTLYAEGPRIRVEYCDSSTNADEIRATLAKTGVATAGAPLASAASTPTP